jgi:hypothetical protein
MESDEQLWMLTRKINFASHLMWSIDDGYLINPRTESEYFGVTSLCSVLLVVTLQLWEAEAGNDYLEAKQQGEIIFRVLEGKTLKIEMVLKDLGLSSSY